MTVATVATIKAQLAVLQAAIPNVKRAYADIPRGPINDADLPLFINFARDAENDWTMIGSDIGLENRRYLMQLLVMPAQDGISGESESLTEAWLQTVNDYFAARPQLGLQSGVQRAYIEGDSGPRLYSWANGLYWNIEFRLRVVTYHPRTYASNE